VKTKILILALVLALSLLVAGLAQANGGVEQSREVLSGGASDSTGGDVSLRATLGQPVVGVVSGTGGEVTLEQGFWHAVAYRVYLPLVVRSKS
jgi:hypothetical protein